MGLCIALTHVNLSFGQAGAYSFSSSTATFTPLTAGTDVNSIEADFAISAAIPLGFTFDFEGTPYTSIKAGSDGFISFNSSATATGTNDLDNTISGRRPLIAPLWDNLDGRATGSVSKASYEVSGTAPNRVFTFEWLNWEWNSTSSAPVVSFQVKLYETSNNIEFAYRWETASALNSPTASIGLTGTTTFLSVSGIGTGTPVVSNSLETSNIDTIVTNQVFTFMPPACVAPTFTPATNVSVTAATVNFTPGTGTYEINWDVAGFTQGAPSSNTATSATNSYTASGLSASTAYDFYVRRDCGGSVYSAWAGPFTVNTPYVPPYLEDWSNGYPNDWKESDGQITDSTIFTSTSASDWTNGSFNSSGSASARINLYGSGRTEWLISPSIDLGIGNTYQANFDLGLTAWNTSNASTLGVDDTIKFVISTDNGITWSDTNTLMTWHSGSNIPNGNGTLVNVSLAGYSGVVKFAFYAESSASNADNDFYMDNFEVRIPPACPKPTALADSNATTTSIDLGWQSNGSGPWYILWGPCNFNQATPGVTIDTATTNSITLSGMTANTSYEFRLFEDCGVNGFSDTVVYGCASTACGALAVPFTEGFNSTSTTQNCWTVLDVNNDADAWNMDYATNAFEGDESAMIYTDFNNGANNDWLISPGLILSNNERLKFQHRVQSANEPNDFMILVSTTGTSPADFQDTLLPLASYNNTSYQQMTLSLAAYSGTVYLAWHVPAGGLDGWRLYIDEVIVEPIPACLTSTNFSSYFSTADSIGINWTAGSTSINHGIEYGPTGFTPGNGTFGSTVDTFFVAKPLLPKTTYDFYLTDTCASGFSTTVGPITVTTPCVKQTLPFTESFGVDLGCFIVSQNGGSTNDTWEWVTDLATNTVDGNNGFALVNSDGAGSGVSMDEILSSPVFDASAITGALILEFDQYYRSLGDVADVDVWDGTQWVTLLNQTTTKGAWGTPDHQYIDVTAHANADFQVRFHYYNANYAWYWGIDNFSLSVLPCGIASNLDTGIVTPNSAVLKWASNGSLWNIEWGPQGFFQGSGSTGGGTVIKGVSTNPYLLTSLGADSCYDYYVQDTCLNTGTGAWVGPFTFCTKPTCPAPTNLGLDPGALTINSADVYFTPGYATNFDVNYGSVGFVAGTGTNIAATNDTVTIPSLTPGTAYEFYVRDVCSATDSSKWSGPVRFVTPFNTNYLQDFTAATPFAWTEADGRLRPATQFTATSSSWGTANFANAGSNGSHKVNIYTSAQYEWLISPSIYLDPVKTNLQVEFDAAMTEWINTNQGYFGADDTLALVISTDNGATWSSSNILWYHDVNDTLDAAGEHFVLPLTGYSGYVKFGFYAGSVQDDNPDNDWFVDNFEVRTPRACSNPTAITASNIKIDSATIGWTAGTPGFIGASVIYTVGNQPASAGTVVTGTTNPIVLSGLLPSTGYCVYVVEQCANGYSDTIGPFCFTTQCVAVTAPFFEDFENFTVGHFDGGQLCWNFNSNNPGTTPSGNFSWEVRNSVQTTSANTGPNGDHTLYPAIGGKWIHSDNSGGSSNDSTMFMSPVVDITSLANPELEYWFHNFAAATSIYRQPLYVDLYDGTTWYYKVHVIDSVFQTSGTDAWQDTTINLTPYSSTGTIQVRFRTQITRSAGGAGDVAIDDVSIRNSSSCVNPTNVVATAGNCDTATVSWTSDAGTTSSTLVYTLKGAGVGAGTVVGSVTSPYTISGLLMNTEYDVYIIDSCTAGFSSAAGPATFRTDSVGPVLASFTWTQSDTTLVDATVDFDAAASTGDGLTYSWDFGNTNTGAGVNSSASYTMNQGYTVKLTVTDRCGNTDDTTITVTVTNISVAENVFNAGIDVYPNPSKGNFNVKVSGAASDYSIEVTDLSGKVIYRKANLASDAEQNINLGDVAQGVYIVRFSGKGLNASQRIIVD